MDRIKDAHVIRLIEQIGVHYKTNISNRFLRPLMLQLQIDKPTWDRIEFLTEKLELFRYQGFHLDELYLSIAACARFVDLSRSNLIPNLKNKISTTSSASDKILRDMAANNFPHNLDVFADLLNSLLTAILDIDKYSAGKKPPVFSQMPEMINVSSMLGGL
ncbi:MAG: hypothetical protein FWC03_02270 [Treponema sp.]|nr:hypothetical protein [Treponema sp.]